MKLLKNERFENNVECPKRKININAFDFVPNRTKIGLLKYHEHTTMTTMTTITTTTSWAHSSANSFINRLFIIGFLGHNFVDAVCFMQFTWKWSLSCFCCCYFMRFSCGYSCFRCFSIWFTFSDKFKSSAWQMSASYFSCVRVPFFSLIATMFPFHLSFGKNSQTFI